MTQSGSNRFGHRKLFAGLFTLGLCLGMAGCGASADEVSASERGAGEQSDAVHVVTFEDGSTVEFRELDYGWVAYTGQAPIGTPSALARLDFSGSVVDVFRQLRPAEPVPAALSALATRQAERAARPIEAEILAEDGGDERLFEEETGEEEASSIVPKHNGHEEFEEDFCTTDRLTTANSNQRVKTVVACVLHGSGARSNQVSNAKQAFGAVSVFAGSITYSYHWRASSDDPWELLGTNPVESGFFRTVRVTQDGPRLNLKFQISDATGASHHRTVVADTYLCKSGCSWNGSVCGCGV